MLKITKGLNAGGITTYTDDKGNRYVRVREDEEDFCIAAHDCFSDMEDKFTWDDAMKLTKQKAMKLPTMKQISILKSHLGDINDVIEEIGGDELKDDWYWMSTTEGDDYAWSYNSHGGTDNNYVIFNRDYKVDLLRVRLVLNL